MTFRNLGELNLKLEDLELSNDPEENKWTKVSRILRACLRLPT